MTNTNLQNTKLTITCSIFLALATWLFIRSNGSSQIENIGAFVYLSLSVALLAKLKLARYLAYLVLSVHLAFTLFVSYILVRVVIHGYVGEAETNRAELGYSAIGLVAPEGYSIKLDLMKSLFVLVLLLFCFYTLTNKSVINLFRGKNV